MRLPEVRAARTLQGTYVVSVDAIRVTNEYYTVARAWRSALVHAVNLAGRLNAPVLVQGPAGAFTIAPGLYPQVDR